MPSTASPAVDDIQFLLERVSSTEAVGWLWRRLEEGSDVPFFVSWTWIGTWLACVPGHIRPLLLTATRGGETIGAAILVPRRERRRGILNVRQLHFNTTGDPALDCIWIEHNGFVGSADAQQDLWPAFLRWFARQRDYDELLVPRVGEAIAGLPADVRLLHAMASSPAFRSVLPPGGTEDILASFSANTRQQLRRSLRACEAMGALRCEVADSVETALAWFDAMKALHVASWEERGKPHAFRYPFVEIFHRALIARGVLDGSIRMLRISAGVASLAYLYNFRRGETVCAYQSGFDYGREELRPGYVSHLLAMAMSVAEGATRYDFLAGDNQLKQSLGSNRYAMRSHRFAMPVLALRVEHGARQVWHRLRRAGLVRCLRAAENPNLPA
jgi:CelD/BcsL family acetyltransferase involved in cellulose biosynthesis